MSKRSVTAANVFLARVAPDIDLGLWPDLRSKTVRDLAEAAFSLYEEAWCGARKQYDIMAWEWPATMFELGDDCEGHEPWNVLLRATFFAIRHIPSEKGA